MSERTYTAIASASWAHALYLTATLAVLLRQRIALAALWTYVLIAEARHELRRTPAPRHAAPRRSVRTLTRYAR